MMRTTQLVAAICAALALTSCGGDDGDPIPARQAVQLERLLQQIQRQSDAGACTTLLETTIPALEQRADGLPDSVGSDTRETITDGIAHLRDLAETDCTEEQQPEQTTTEETTPETTTPEETTETTTPEETTTEEETTPPETTTEETTPETTTPEEGQPGEEGNGGTPPGQSGGTPPGQERGRQAGRGDDGGEG
jgi:hypothetical protein